MSRSVRSRSRSRSRFRRRRYSRKYTRQRRRRSKHRRTYRGGALLSGKKVVGTQAYQMFKSGVGKLHEFLNKQDAKYGSQMDKSKTSFHLPNLPPRPPKLPPRPLPQLPPRPSSSRSSMKKIPTYKTPQYAKGYISPYKKKR